MPEKEKQFYKEPATETQEQEPKISYEIFYSAHGTAKDIEGLQEAFKNCDIYVPEASNWDPELLTDFQALSCGEKTPRKLREKYGWPKNSSDARESKIIYQSQKPILFADLGEGHKLEEIDDQADALFAQSFDEFENGKFFTAIQTMRKSAAKGIEYNREREKTIETNLKTKVQELIENNPQLKNKGAIKVLLFLGTIHTPLFHSLKKEKLSTTRQFANSLLIFLNQEETLRRIIFSKEVSDELLAKIFVEWFLEDYFLRITDDTNKNNRIIRNMTANISLDEIRNLSENWNDKESKHLPIVLRNFFQNKGIKIPESEKEIDGMLKKGF